LWLGVCNSYFDAIVRPDAGPGAPVHIAAAPAVAVDDTTHDCAFNLVTAPFTLAPGAAAPFDLHAFFGPKQRQLLKNDYYSAFPRGYDVTLVYISKFCGLLTFGWLINVLYGILWFFHLIFRDWGLAIICLVVLVRTCLHPITKRSQIHMMGMSKMGPEIERLKKKYGDDKEGLNKAMMGVYKEQGMTPILGCLPMLLQTPIWLALWNALQSTFEIRQAGFLRWGHVHLTWIADLSQPDKLFAFSAPLHLPFGYEMHSINVLPVLLAGVFYVQQRMMPQPANLTPEQEQQRKMMKFMPLIYPLFFYVSPSGLNLYILTSTSLGIVESKIVRKHIKDREEAEKAGKIIVDAGPTRKNKRDDTKKKEPPKKTTGIAGFLANLQTKAEQVVREAEQRKKNEGRR
jgi:YidC/Oxa1 family membrane protein insertase